MAASSCLVYLLVESPTLTRLCHGLMTTDMVGIGWVRDLARIGDEVYLVRRCSIPMVLRRDPQYDPCTISSNEFGQPMFDQGAKKYTAVGYALVEGWLDRDQWEEAPDVVTTIPTFDTPHQEWLWWFEAAR